MAVYLSLIQEVLLINLSIGGVNITLGGLSLGIIVLFSGASFFRRLAEIGKPSVRASLDFSDVTYSEGSPWAEMGREPEWEPDIYE